MKKIVIIGSAGAGKSTLARQLGEILQIEVIHLDSLFWRSGWRKMPKRKQIALQRQLVQKAAWIMDGSYHATLGSRINAADTVIFLDMPLLICIGRVIKRHFAKQPRPDLPKQCRDKLDWSYFVKVGNFPRKDRNRLIAHLQEAQKSGKETAWLRSRKEVLRYLQEVREKVEVAKEQRQSVGTALVSV